MSEECNDCEFEPVEPQAQFMFTSVEKCKNCGNIRRSEEDDVRHFDLPLSERKLLDE